MSRSITRPIILFLTSLVSCVLLLPIACSRSAPVYRASQIQLLRVQTPTGTFAERLSVFVFFDDDDGPADFGSLTVTHTDTELMWKVLPDQTVVRLRGTDRWTGTNNLAGPGDGLFPEGDYTLTVTDLAGNEAVSPFVLTRPDFPQRAPVSFSVKDGTWTLERNQEKSAFHRTYFMLYDSSSKLLFSWLVPDGAGVRTSGTVESLRKLAGDTVSVRCYTENDAGTAGVLLSPVHIR